MNENSIWKRAQTIELMVSNDISQGFNIGFDKGIPKEVEKELRFFVKWMENNYGMLSGQVAHISCIRWVLRLLFPVHQNH